MNAMDGKARMAWLRTLALVLAAALTAPAPSARAFQVNGLSLVSWGWDDYGSTDSTNTLRWMKALGASDVVIVTENYVDPTTDTVASLPGLTGPNANLAKTIVSARALGLTVTVKPSYVNSQTNSSLAWPTYVPKDYARFFRSYQANLLAHARIAAQAGAARLVIGTEFGGQITGKAHLAAWTAIIRQVRAVFTGKLTYAATFSAEWSGPYADEASYLSFWSQLDEAGFNFYPNLTRSADPSLATLIAKFTRNDDGNDTIAHLIAVAARVGKPVLLTESGFRSVRNFWDTGDWSSAYPIDDAAQTRLHTANLSVLTGLKAPWLEGVFLWQCLAYTRAETVPSSWWDSDFTFQGKPAAKVIQAYFKSHPPG
jgi:hypothetical protein